MIPGQIRDLRLSEDFRQLDLDSTPLFPCSCYNVDVRLNVAQEVPWHWHREIEAISVIQGRGLFQASGESWLLEAGDGIFLNTNVLHSVHLPEGENCRFYSLVFSAELLAGMPGSIFEQRYIRPLLGSSTRAVPLYRNEPWRQEAVVRGALSQMWVLMAEHMTSPGSAATETNDIRRLKEMLQFLHAHYDQPVSLEEIAGTANIGKRECLRCFQRTIGVTPIQYLLKYRVRKASSLLAETDLPVTEVALRCGFESPSYFSLMFRRLIGRTPRDYRRYFSESLDRQQ